MQAAIGDPQARRTADDAELLASLRRGDRDAFTTLVDTNSAWMMRIARSYVRSRAAAEDTVQEAWIRCLRGLDGFEGRASLRTWLYRIATNRCLNVLRSASRRPAQEWNVP